MARDSTVGRDRVLIVPGSLALDSASSQHPNVPQTDINQQILEVNIIKTTIKLINQLFTMHNVEIKNYSATMLFISFSR